MAKEKITKDMLIGEVVKKYPKTVNVMMDYGLQCVGCHVAAWETVEQGAQSHGINVDKMVREMNKKTGGG